MSIGKIWNSLASASVENSLSLVQLNFDFTFLKTDAPLEYRTIGQAMSNNRRFNAEKGASHRTAMKLGWLFGEVIPKTPELLKAYGRRVSEILQKPGINPTGSEADGPFREYVGADCTSLWAAATSGFPALGVHLLACMLARAWDAQTATAIWSELVEKRRLEIFNNVGQGSVSIESQAAAQQEFLRKELEEWDASARAWLSQADRALAVQRDQYLLIVKNVSLSTGNTKDPYPNVLAAWTNAMTALENHLKGISQQISDGSVLYAISAWHLYPDLVHFGDGVKKVAFSDLLFTKPATMTLGLTEVATTQENRGTHWSLALSHLRSYGDPVSVESVEDRTRATISQFQVVILGSVLEAWRVGIHERLDAIRWIHELWTYLQRTAPITQAEMRSSGHTSWLAGLAEAADIVLSATGSDLEQYQDFLGHAEYWGTNFLLDDDQQIQALQPYFGLCNPMVMAALQEPLDVEAGIELLRQLAKNMGLRDQDAIICYSDRSSEYHEYCTAVPHSDPLGGSSHARWIKLGTKSGPVNAHEFCQHKCHKEETTQASEVDLDHRMNMIQARGEACYVLGEGSLHEETVPLPGGPQKKAQFLIWEHSVPLFRSDWTCNNSPTSIRVADKPCTCLAIPEGLPPLDHEARTPDVTFTRYLGTRVVESEERRDYFELYIRTTSTTTSSQRSSYGRKLIAATSLIEQPSHGSQWLKSHCPQPNRVWDYIQSLAIPFRRNLQRQLVMREGVPTPDGLDWQFSHGRTANLMNNIIAPPPRQWVRSLELLGVVAEVYKGLPGATISLGVLDYPLCEGYWTALDNVTRLANVQPRRKRELLHGSGELLREMGREELFSCIAMMETGVSNIQPESLKEVVAMSASNSIFVASSLLSDPYDLVPAKNIRHIVGNVGFAGLNLMHAPAGELKISRPVNQVQKISRSNFDAKRENHFHGSSLHLWFTGERLPLVTVGRDTTNQGIFYLESVVSLWDNGKHIADLDMLRIEREDVTRITLNCSCAVPKLLPDNKDIRCLDSWQDVLLSPRRMGILRAHGNWYVRLAAVVLLLQQQRGHSIGILSPETLCWRCLESHFEEPEPHMPQILVD
jgi:hypothetical protein